jgi:DSF synthase
MNRNFLKIFDDYQEISARYDQENRAVWCYYNPSVRPCFSSLMLHELKQLQYKIIDYFAVLAPGEESLIRYQILNSQIPGVFNLGGDLALFSQLIREKNRQLLADYARQCIDICYLNSVNLNLPITTISLVEGMALGGGFESALSSNVLIATENSEMGFPEIRFNLFPGMGAYSLLARSCGMRLAEQLIYSGETYTAGNLYKMGIVHRLAEPGRGLAAVESFMKKHHQSGNGYRALQQVRQRYHRLDYQELSDIVKIWVDTAMRLEEKDLRLIDRLVKVQSAKMAYLKQQSMLRTRQDRRFVKVTTVFPFIDRHGKIVVSDRRTNPDRRLYN